MLISGCEWHIVFAKEIIYGLELMLLESVLSLEL